MSSTNEPNTESLKQILPGEQVSLDRPYQKSSPATPPPMSPSKSSKRLPTSLDAASVSSSIRVLSEWMKMSSCAAPTLQGVNSSTRTTSSTRSTKPTTKYDTVVPADQSPWVVELHRQVGKEVAGYSFLDRRFSPTLRELMDALRANPKQFRKKKGNFKVLVLPTLSSKV
jgi:hypothetical protein